MGTLKKDRTLLRDERKMEKLKAKLHTDDDCERNGGVDAPLVSGLLVGCLSSFCEFVIYLFPLLGSF